MPETRNARSVTSGRSRDDLRSAQQHLRHGPPLAAPSFRWQMTGSGRSRNPLFLQRWSCNSSRSRRAAPPSGPMFMPTLNSGRFACVRTFDRYASRLPQAAPCSSAIARRGKSTLFRTHGFWPWHVVILQQNDTRTGFNFERSGPFPRNLPKQRSVSKVQCSCRASTPPVLSPP